MRIRHALPSTALRLGMLIAGTLVTSCDGGPSGGRVLVAASFQDGAAKVLGDRAIVVSAASSTLARQIVSGAPADCFVSANEQWMDFVATRGLLEPESRRELVRNALVLVAPKRAADSSRLDLAAFQGRLAMGDPGHVPAGVYGREALRSAGHWSRLQSSVIPTANVREALALVERDEVDLGLVYRTDALGSDRVRVVHEFVGPDAPEVVYEIALVKGGDRELWSRLTAAEAQVDYRSLGFKLVSR